MSYYYMLNTRGLNYLVSSSDPSAIRRYLFYILAMNSKQSITMEQLVSWDGRSRDVVSSLVEKLLEREWLKRVEKDEYNYDQSDHGLVFKDYSVLSSTGQILLADLNGLVIFNQGFAEDKAKHLAATASQMLSINEVSRQRNLDLYTGQAWTVALHWGAVRVKTQYICLDSKKFVLVSGGRSQFDKPEFFTLLAALVRRYTHE